MIDACVVGVDPGLSGAVAFFYPTTTSDRVITEDIPVVGGFVDCATLSVIRKRGPTFAVVERVASRPDQGIASAFKFGTTYGSVLGVLAALQIRTVLVTPGTWKKHFRLDSDKEKSCALALRTFAKSPEHFARKRDHDRAEAALLALYGASLNSGA